MNENINEIIYFDNAATTLHKPPAVPKAVADAMYSMANTGRGAYDAALAAAEMIYEARERVVKLFHADSPKSVAFTCNATEALNTVIQGLFKRGDHVISTAMEHNSVLRPLYLMETCEGVELTILPADREGNINYGDIEAALKPNTKAVVCTGASNVTGNIVDMEEVGRICQRSGILLVVDASQTAGVIPIDMQRQNMDVLCFTGHKALMGPQGTGGICVRRGVKISPLKVGGSGIMTYSKIHPEEMPTALEAGTLNGHGIAGLNAGLQYIEEVGLKSIEEKETALLQRFYNGVSQIPGVKIYGDFSRNRRAAILSLNIGNMDSGIAGDLLAHQYSIFVRTGGHCAPLMHEALGTTNQGVVRFSFSSFNTVQEIDKGIEAVRELALR